MMAGRRFTRRIASNSWAPAACIVAALLLVLALGGWGAYRDWEHSGLSVIQATITRVRSHAERTAVRLENELHDLGTSASLVDVANSRWLRGQWNRKTPPVDRRFAAVIDVDGLILAHSNPENRGQTLCSNWNASPVSSAGPGIFDTCCPALADGDRTLDVVVPISMDNHLIGAYHSGIDWKWLQQEVAAAQRRSLWGWELVIGAIVIVVLLSSISLYWTTRRSAYLERELALAQARHLDELSHLMAGLAHEIRNPLNAVQLNLFTADRVFRKEAELDHDEVTTMLGESVREIRRVDDLISLLLAYVRTTDDPPQLVNISNEIHAVQRFLMPSFAACGVDLRTSFDQVPAFMRAGRGHVRQVLLNLLNNARDAAPREAGVVRVALESGPQTFKVAISDNGPGIAPEQRERVFTPFYSTKENGTGLGLAIVRRLMAMDGGSVSCEDAAGGGCCFVVSWPAAVVSSEEAPAA